MSDRTIFFKYDGSSTALSHHQIDAKLLSMVLSGFADLIYEANTLINGTESSVDVKTKAGFVEGSFGVELIISQDLVGQAKDLLEVLGIVGFAVSGGLIAAIQHLKGRPVLDYKVDDATGDVLLEVDGETVRVDEDVSKLVMSPSIRGSIDRVIYEPLQREGISEFKLSDEDDFSEPLLEVGEREVSFYQKPPMNRVASVRETDTVAIVEFVSAKKESGSKGWRMVYQGDEVSVVIKDDAFMNSIRRPNAPSIFGERFRVELNVVKKARPFARDSARYTILKVQSRVK